MRMANCGGNWGNTGNAGVFYVNLNNPRSNSNTNIGFRAALATMKHVRSFSLKGLIPVQSGKRIASPWPLPKNHIAMWNAASSPLWKRKLQCPKG
jgi:hypothetical protein